MVCEFLSQIKVIQPFPDEMDGLKEEGIVPNFSVLHSAIEKCNVQGNGVAESFDQKKHITTTSAVAHIATKETMWRSHSTGCVWNTNLGVNHPRSPFDNHDCAVD